MSFNLRFQTEEESREVSLLGGNLLIIQNWIVPDKKKNATRQRPTHRARALRSMVRTDMVPLCSTTSVSGSLSCYLIMEEFFQMFIWKWYSCLAYLLHIFHVSQPKSRVIMTTELYDLSLELRLSPLLLFTYFLSLANEALALVIQLMTSASILAY